MFYNIRPAVSSGRLALMVCALVFSGSYAFVEYYVIRDTTFGMHPVLFSLIYPYHLVMGVIFGGTSYLLLRANLGVRGLISTMVMSGALCSSMLAAEDFMWFGFRALAPLHGDMNPGKLVMAGEWSTQFLGSVDAHYTAIPNWYFVSMVLTVLMIFAYKARPRIAEAVASAP